MDYLTLHHFFLAAEYAIAAICFSLRFLPAGFSLLARVSSWMFADTALFMAWFGTKTRTSQPKWRELGNALFCY